MTPELKVKVSRYMSYLLRHNSENLEIDEEGFVDLDKLLGKLREIISIQLLPMIKCFRDSSKNP